MCKSSSECKKIRKSIENMPFQKHEEQLSLCHQCMIHGNSYVKESYAYKTDLMLRLSYVKKYLYNIQL